MYDGDSHYGGVLRIAQHTVPVVKKHRLFSLFPSVLLTLAVTAHWLPLAEASASIALVACSLSVSRAWACVCVISLFAVF